MYEGPERRKYYDELPVLIERWNTFIQITEDYRKQNDEKIESVRVILEKNTQELLNAINDMKEGILKLPCREQAIINQGIKAQLKYMWGFISALVLLMVGEFIKWKR